MTNMVRVFIQQMGSTYSSYAELEKETELTPEISDYFDQLFEDMIDQAKTGYVRIVDVNSEAAEGYELDTVEDCLAYCSLPESVMEFADESGCDYGFIGSLFAIAESQNEVPGFQLAEGKVLCNWISAYRTLSADYGYFKETVEAELSELAHAQGQTKKEFVQSHSVYVYGNPAGEEFFQRFLGELV